MNRSRFAFQAGCWWRHLTTSALPFFVSTAMIAFVLGLAARLLADELAAPTPQLDRVFSGRSPKFEDLKPMQDHLQALAEQVGKCTVHLRVGDAHGSGTIVKPEGIVLTAAHVVGLPDELVSVHLPDGRGVMGHVLGVDLGHDLALVQLNERGPWPFLELSHREMPARGEWCAAAGHPGGFDGTRGIVFRVGRVLHAGSLLRTDCELIGGDSGGPLVDMQGHVLGVHSRIGVSVLTNLHIPASTVLESWDAMLKSQVLRGRAHLGIKASKDAVDCVVSEVLKGSAADGAGVRIGDLITHFDGQRIRRFSELMALVQTREPGDDVSIGIIRDGKELQLEITIGDRHGG